MIHHQVAVDMSKELLDNTKNDFMIHCVSYSSSTKVNYFVK